MNVDSVNQIGGVRTARRGAHMDSPSEKASIRTKKELAPLGSTRQTEQVLEEIAREIARGKAEGRKTVTIHYQVFKNAKDLRHLSPRAFCEAVGIEPSWQIEFSKMINLAGRLEEDGLEVAPIRK